MDEAAIAAGEICNKNSKESYDEWAVVIYLDGDGKYKLSDPIPGTYNAVPVGRRINELESDSKQVVGYVHSHANVVGYETEHLSEPDVMEFLNYTAYVATPGGKLKRVGCTSPKDFTTQLHKIINNKQTWPERVVYDGLTQQPYAKTEAELIAQGKNNGGVIHGSGGGTGRGVVSKTKW